MKQPLVVCYGAGVDSTAMLVGLRNAGIRPDLITFADTGCEKFETYAYLDVMDAWLTKQGFPIITRCRYKPLASTGYTTLAGNCFANETLPSLAFGMKSCSIKYKQGPQDHVIKGCTKGPNKCEPHPIWLHARANGMKITKAIGYDSGKADIRRSGRVKEDDDFDFWYPLQEWGWDREKCVEAIAREGLPVPIKSACFFCPASQKWELWWLAGTHPEQFMEALAIEHRAMTGRHSSWGKSECYYDDEWEAFISKRADRWPSTAITVGLGRTFAWNHWARENNIVCRKTGKFIGNRAHCLEMASHLKKTGGNARDGRSCSYGAGTEIELPLNICTIPSIDISPAANVGAQGQQADHP